MILRELVNLIGFKINESQWNKAEARVTAMQGRMDKFGRRMSLMFTLPFAFLTAKLGKTLSMFEQLDVAFETMVGSADKANKLVTEMLEFAAETPFEIKEIGPTVKQLLAMGSSAEIVLDELEMLGNVAAGLSVPISRLALNFGQVRAQGKLTGRELRDFAIAGVPLREELAKSLGVTTAAIADMVSTGQIGFDQVKDAFKKMSGEGGRFANLMIKQAKTLGGLWSNLLDIITLSMRSFEKELLPIFKKVVTFLITIVKTLNDRVTPTMKTIIFFLGVIVAGIGPLLLAFAGILKLGSFVSGAFLAISMAAKAANKSTLLFAGKLILMAAAAAAVIAIIPTITVGLIGQRYLVRGLTMGAVK